MRDQETILRLKAALDDTSTRSPDSSTPCAHEQPEVGGDDASKEPNLHSRAAVKTAPSQAMQGESPSPPPAAAEMPGEPAGDLQARPIWRSKGRRKGGGKGKDAGHAAWLLGLGSAIQEPAKELAEGAKEPEPEVTATVLEPLSKAREVESAEAESTREAESPRDTDSPVAKTVDQEASYIEGSTSTGDGAEAHISKGGVEETRIICETDPNEVIAWRELFFKLGEVDEKPSSSSAQQAPSEHGTWGEKGSLARLLRREGLEMPEPSIASTSSFDVHPAEPAKPAEPALGDRKSVV